MNMFLNFNTLELVDIYFIMPYLVYFNKCFICLLRKCWLYYYWVKCSINSWSRFISNIIQVIDIFVNVIYSRYSSRVFICMLRHLIKIWVLNFFLETVNTFSLGISKLYVRNIYNHHFFLIIWLFKYKIILFIHSDFFLWKLYYDINIDTFGFSLGIEWLSISYLSISF